MALWQNLKTAYRAVTDSKPLVFWRQWGRFAWMPISAGVDLTYSQDTAPPLLGNIGAIGTALALRNVRGALPFVLPTIAYAGGRALGYKLIGKSPWARRGETVKARIVDTALASNQSLTEVQEQDSNTVTGLAHKGVAGATRSQNTEFGSGWTGLGFSAFLGAGTGYALGGRTGAVIGTVAGLGLGIARDRYLKRLEESQNQGWKSAISVGTTTYALDTLSDLGMVGLARGGLFYNPLRSIGEKVLGADRLERAWSWATKRSPAGPAGFVVQISDLPNLVLPKRMHKMVNRYMGAGAVFEALEAAGGLENISKLDLLKGFGKTALYGIPTAVIAGTIGYFVGRNKAPNQFDGFQEKGVSSRNRKRNTDFGSGHRGDDETRPSRLLSKLAASAGVSLGVGVTLGVGYSFTNVGRYQRLASMQAVGQQFGLMTYSRSFSGIIDEPITKQNILPRIAIESLYGPLSPTTSAQKAEQFPGLVYLREGSGQAVHPINIGQGDIGVNKVTTWEFFKSRGIENLHAYSVTGSEFYRDPQVAQDFIKRAGGLENIVVKEAEGSLGQGVWMDASKLPSNIPGRLEQSPQNYLLQQRLDLAAEFRAVTVGDKSIYTAHRFGPEWLRKILPSRLSENILPVLNPETKQNLVQFTEKVAGNLPYEIGAMDIGLTKGGEFFLIEAQRQFGTMTNPIVASRIRNILTKRPGGLAIGAMAVAGIATALFVGRNKAPNAIKGHDSGHWGREQTFASGDFEPGSSWKGIFNRVAGFFGYTPEIRAAISAARAAERTFGPAQRAVALRRASEAVLQTRGKTLEGFIRSVGVQPVNTTQEWLQAIGMEGRAEYTANAATRKLVEEHVAGLLRGRGITYDAFGVSMVSTHNVINTNQAVKRARTAFHEASELFYIQQGMVNPALQTTLRHTNLGVIYGEAAFSQQMGLSLRDTLGALKRKADPAQYKALKRITKQGWKAARKTNQPIIKISAHDADRWGRETVFAGGDFEPGSSWIKDAIRRGVAWDKIGAATIKMREPAEAFVYQGAGKMLEEAYKTGGLEAVTKLTRAMTTMRVGEHTYALGRSLSEGSFKRATEVFRTGHVRGSAVAPGQNFAWTEFHSSYLEPLQANSPVYTTPFMRTSLAGVRTKRVGLQQAQDFLTFYENTMKGHFATHGNRLLDAEVAAQRMARVAYGDVVPNVVATTDRGLLQEFAGVQVPEKYMQLVHKKIAKTFNTMMSGTGNHVIHFDLHPGNILRKGGKLRVIDWGLAAPGAVIPEITATSQELTEFYAYKRGIHKTSIGTLPGTLKGPDVGTTEDLRRVFRDMQTQTNLQLAKASQISPIEEKVGTHSSKLTRMKMDIGQQQAQSLPFEMHAARRRSHGKTRTRTKK